MKVEIHADEFVMPKGAAIWVRNTLAPPAPSPSLAAHMVAVGGRSVDATAIFVASLILAMGVLGWLGLILQHII